jgi:nucleoside 2-deoxyribosyltransferase
MVKIYIAGPLFTEIERGYLEDMDEFIRNLGFNTYLPHRDGGLFIRGVDNSLDFFKKDVDAIKSCNILIAILNGSDIDSGTSWEMGFAYSNGIPIIGMLNDTRKPNLELLNPMILNSSIKIVKDKDELKEALEKYE